MTTEEGSRAPQATTDGGRTEESETGCESDTKIDMDKMKDKAFVKQFITDISTKGIKFLYHKESNNSGLSRSDRVLVRLHMGSQG